MIAKMVATADALTITEGVPFILVSPKANPQVLYVVCEACMAIMPEPVDVLHSGRTPLEV